MRFLRFALCLAGAAVGFLVTAILGYVLFVEVFHLQRGAVKLTAPLALGGAVLGYEVVHRGMRLVGLGGDEA